MAIGTNGFGSRPAGCGCCVSRRSFLGGLSALAATGLVSDRADAQAPAPFRVDVHHHPYFQSYAAEAAKRYPPMPKFLKTWTREKTLDDMDKAGIQTSMLSMAL